MTHDRQAQQLARRLFQLSLAEGAVSSERVAAVLEYVARHRPANPLLVLRSYRRLIAAELAKGVAVVEHAGVLPESALQGLVAGLARRYGRPLQAAAKPDPALVAGLRVRVADDLYELSVAGGLAALAAPA